MMTIVVMSELKIIRIQSKYPLGLRLIKTHIGYIGTTCEGVPVFIKELCTKTKSLNWRVK